MSTLVSAMSVRFDDDSMWVDLNDGRTIGVSRSLALLLGLAG